MNPIQIITASINCLDRIIFKNDSPVIVLIKEDTMCPTYHYCSIDNDKSWHSILSQSSILYLLFISDKDKFNWDTLGKDLQSLCFYGQNSRYDFAFLIPYKEPPTYRHREDEFVNSFMIIAKMFSYKTFFKRKATFEELIFDYTLYSLNLKKIKAIDVIQLSKPIINDNGLTTVLSSLEKSLLVIPHKGSSRLLQRCLSYLESNSILPASINVCFDDISYKKSRGLKYTFPSAYLCFYKNSPLNVGPYLARHNCIVRTKKDYIFFQDSDDISTHSRFSKQLYELQKRNLDLIGSHELRIDQINRKILAVRFPLDANKSLAAKDSHSLFHPTSLITKNAYVKAGGFSTNMRFGYDTQFLLRAFFFLKIGNVDEFLYIRFKRPNSLTTNPKTKIGSNLRGFLLWRWIVDFRLINENKLDLSDSSLSRKKHNFKYRLERLNP